MDRKFVKVTYHKKKQITTFNITLHLHFGKIKLSLQKEHVTKFYFLLCWNYFWINSNTFSLFIFTYAIVSRLKCLFKKICSTNIILFCRRSHNQLSLAVNLLETLVMIAHDTSSWSFSNGDHIPFSPPTGSLYKNRSMMKSPMNSMTSSDYWYIQFESLFHCCLLSDVFI